MSDTLRRLVAAGRHAWSLAFPPHDRQRLTVTNDGLTLELFVYRPPGTGPFPALLWNHGRESKPGFDPVAAIFVPAGYAVIGPMRRGHGKSEGQCINDLVRAMRDREGEPAAEALALRLLETEQLSDQIAGLARAKELAFVDADRIVVAGCSYGGVQTLLGAEARVGYRAAFAISAGARTWAANAGLGPRLIRAVGAIDIPTRLIQPPDDASLEPSRVLGEEARRRGKANFTTLVYPPTMPEDQRGHCFGGAKGMRNWSGDALAFFDAALGIVRARERAPSR